jgi:imidazolonepropionase-like amidohydrolase
MARTVLRNATVIDGTGADGAPADVVIEDDKIVEVGPGLDGDEDVDLSGKWLLPGLIDCHVHEMISTINLVEALQIPFSLNFFLAAQNLEATLKAGFTYVRDAGGTDLGVKRAVELGLIKGPRMKISISILTQTGGHGDRHFPCGMSVPFFQSHPGRPETIADGPEDVIKKVREIVRAGADVIKICTTGGVLSPEDDPEASQFLPEEIEVIVAEARASGREVMSHAQGAAGIKNAVRAGVRSIEHGVFLDDEAIEMMIDSGTFLVPTLIAPHAVLEDARGIPEASLRKSREILGTHADSIRRAYQAGVKIAMGTDAGVFAHGRNAEELIHMTDIGMSPMAAIESTTRIAAENLGIGETTGTIEPGKDADLIALNGDPIADIKVLGDPSNVTDVWKLGRLVE